MLFKERRMRQKNTDTLKCGWISGNIVLSERKQTQKSYTILFV